MAAPRGRRPLRLEPGDGALPSPFDVRRPIRPTVSLDLPFVRQDEKTAILQSSFGEVADEYNRLRSGPSDEALDWLIPGDATDVLEIGAGTGILTRLLADRSERLTAVEPDERMRAVLSAYDARIEVRAGRAEEIPAASSSVDLVIAQSAWHWVDETRAIPEVARVLRPSGRLSLVWTGPDRSVDWVRSLWAGGIIFSPEEMSQEDSRRKRRHLVSVDLVETALSPRPRQSSSGGRGA